MRIGITAGWLRYSGGSTSRGTRDWQDYDQWRAVDGRDCDFHAGTWTSAASGVTDEEGQYDLIYLDGVKGCKLGPNMVVFAVPTGGSPSHAIPKQYQNKSDLKVEVKSGSNTFDFDLKPDATPAVPAKKAGTVVD